MKKTLILTGRSTQYLDYALAAAIALRHFKTADILNMSKDGLPGFLENVDGYSEIVVLGISLTYNQERLAKALAALKKSSVQVFWLSGIAFPASLCQELRQPVKQRFYRRRRIL